MSAGLKATHPRIVVLNELIHSDIHPTADQLYERIKINNPSIARGSVYRILDTLVEAGLANGVSTRQNLKRYDANLGEHSHIYCVKTHTIQDYYDEELNQLIKNFFKQKNIQNFQIKDVKLQINGEKLDADKKVKIV
jgi:Fur family peroxide stress response transcriptional regulator